ncbi:MAG: alanine--tRNA ligase [Candidatus Xiphinematobacter sp.]|nr:MAG: alanine--tRNA ligase [Candidatus Xiphinematobacter sp.]
MTSAEIRSSFLKFFSSKGHSLIRSSSLLPDSPNLLFTNAGMNQFVPIFLGECPPDVSSWPEVLPGMSTRAASTQKCLRAGGKHNDLEDVGLDTYHHTFFEMLGNWSFGDYSKREAIEWAWELIACRWKFPPQRLYASFYRPAPGEPSEIDEEACECWGNLFRKAGLDPRIHVRSGGKKDNFWMMGDNGPCGPCSELHIDLTPTGDSCGNLINTGSVYCMEIWNLVFIQFNLLQDSTIAPLPTQHVDTGMGLERIASVLQGTRGFTDFSHTVSNYETDLFYPLLRQTEKLSGKQYMATLPPLDNRNHQEMVDTAFRVVADHLRTLAFAIADGIFPDNTGRGYVLRRILRRAVRHGRVLGLRKPFLHRLVAVLVGIMGNVFQELISQQARVEEIIRAEEEAFYKTLDKGLQVFKEIISRLRTLGSSIVPGEDAFRLSDTYGFPIDLTQLMAREVGFSVDQTGFEQYMGQQRSLARANQRRELTQASAQGITTQFLGYESLESTGVIRDLYTGTDGTWLALDKTPFYPTMGGQVGDSGYLKTLQEGSSQHFPVLTAMRSGDALYHRLASEGKECLTLAIGTQVQAVVDSRRRIAIERHHSATHLLHWALREVLSCSIAQRGSYVGAKKLTFDFGSGALTQARLTDVEKLVNERILENSQISWMQLPYNEVRGRADVIQIFSEKYGRNVRIVQIGGTAGSLDGYSMELCAGTHCRATGELGVFRIISEEAVATGVRRIEAVAGYAAYLFIQCQTELLCRLAGKLGAPVVQLEQKVDFAIKRSRMLEKQLRVSQQRQANAIASVLLERKSTIGEIPAIVENVGEINGVVLEEVSNSIKDRFDGVLVLGGRENDVVLLMVTVPSSWVPKLSARNIVQEITHIVGGTGGGGTDRARGGGRGVRHLGEALQRAVELIRGAL